MNQDSLPYPGLRPYQEDEYHKFFGRQADAEILIDKLLTNRLTLLFAASGVGKSSLLQAAIIPKLKAAEGENLSVAYHNDWISPPTQSVKLTVLNALQTNKIIATDVDFSDDSLLDILSFSSVLVRPPFVLIFDQFEEFFRYQGASPEFQTFIDQLITLITSPQLALSLVISMREDFALELNAFKPKLPTILFENFYRLEKLGRDTALMAIETPVKQLGFNYESELLKLLTNDLLSRELDRDPNLPIAELRITVEPPYLQIICAHLWELNKKNPDKQLHLASYEKAGRAQGILKSHIEGILASFNHKERQFASLAFDHLVSQRGVKMAYTVPALAKTLKVKTAELQTVLEKLEKVRILRKQQRGEEAWYELYHDMFSISLETWNSAWKDKVRTRRNLKILLGSLCGVCLIIGSIDIYVNSQFYHLRLSAKQDSDRVELWQGMTSDSLWPFDLFRQRHYLAETHLTRDNLEPDKRFSQKNIYRYHDLQAQLIADRPLEERITGLAEIGDYSAAIQLAKDIIIPSNIELAKRAIPHLNAINTEAAVQTIYKHLKETSSETIKSTIANEAIQGTIGIILLKNGTDTLQLESSLIKTISLPENKFWEDQLSFQATRLDVLNKWLNWNVHDLEKLLGTPYIEKVSMYLDEIIKNNSSFNDSAVKVAVDLNTKNIKSYLLNLLITEKDPSTIISIISNLSKLKIEKTTSKRIDKIIDEFIFNIINGLNNGNTKTITTAIKTIASLPNQKTIPLLIKLLKSKNNENRIMATTLLISLQHQSTTPDLIKLLKDESEEIPSATIQSIKNIDSLQTITAIPSLIKLLKDEDKEVRNAVIKVLDLLKAQIAIPELIKLKNTSKIVQINNLLYKENSSISSNLNYILSLSTIDQIDKENKNQSLINKYISQEQLYLLLQKLKQNEVSPTLIALSLEKNTNNLNQTQKRLISKALSLVDINILATAKQELAQLEQFEANTAAKQNALWPPLSAAELAIKITENKNKIADWRRRRDLPDTEPEKPPTTTELKQQEQQTQQAQYDYEYARILAYEYSFDLALVDEATALKLLRDDLYELREAAARGLANSPFLGVALLKKLEKIWLETNNPIERQAVFHAIDLCLVALEHTGTAKELAELRPYLAELKTYQARDDEDEHPAKRSILPRVDWSVILLNWRIEAHKELKAATEEGFPALLEEYCLNPDGSNMSKETCKNPRVLSLYEE